MPQQRYMAMLPEDQETCGPASTNHWVIILHSGCNCATDRQLRLVFLGASFSEERYGQ